jgi:hypothetical protein
VAAVQVRTSPSAVTVYVSGSTVMFGRASLSFMSHLVSRVTLPTASTLLSSPYAALTPLSKATCLQGEKRKGD